MEALRPKIKLQIQEITKSFQTEVLKHMSFEVYENEFLAILGPSGCGKTTLMRILIGLLCPDSGAIYKDGIDITGFPSDRRKMGIVFQNFALFENMTVRQNIEYALKVRKQPKEVRAATSGYWMEKLGLSAHSTKKPGTLSGGQQQRVAVARTLALNPDVILLDEPMSSLDISTRLSLREELKKIQKESDTTMIYITHDQEEAFTMADRIMVMNDGRIHQIDTPADIIRKPADDYVAQFVVYNLEQKAKAISKFFT